MMASFRPLHNQDHDPFHKYGDPRLSKRFYKSTFFVCLRVIVISRESSRRRRLFCLSWLSLLLPSFWILRLSHPNRTRRMHCPLSPPCLGECLTDHIMIASHEESLDRSLKEIRAAIPSHFFIRDTTRGLLYLARDILLAAIAWSLASSIDPYFKSASARNLLTPMGAELFRWSAWCV